MTSCAARFHVTMFLFLFLSLIGCGSAPSAPPPAPTPVAAEALPPIEAWVGSSACAACHAEPSAQWAESWHARTVRPASPEDLDALSSLLSCADLPASTVLGGRHELRFMLEQPEVAFGAGRWLTLPCGRNRKDEPTMHHPSTWRELPWEQKCAGCHVTGFRGPDAPFPELGVGCEACHGPGAAHARTGNPAAIVAFPKNDSIAVCASCHLQGAKSARTGLHIPDKFVPGRPLFDDWKFDFDALDPEGSPVDVHQKLLVRDHLAGTTDLLCTSCHEVHAFTHKKHSANPQTAFCDSCHQPDLTLKEYEQSCDVCEF